LDQPCSPRTQQSQTVEYCPRAFNLKHCAWILFEQQHLINSPPDYFLQ